MNIDNVEIMSYRLYKIGNDNSVKSVNDYNDYFDACLDLDDNEKDYIIGLDSHGNEIELDNDDDDEILRKAGLIYFDDVFGDIVKYIFGED